LEWNLAANPNQEPHTDIGGCTRCLGAITIDGDIVERNPAYYIIAHASKFVHPGTQRISSTFVDKLPNVAFRTLDKKIVLIVFNKNRIQTQFNVSQGGINFLAELPAGSVATIIF
jgi:glucosylceramidase